MTGRNRAGITLVETFVLVVVLGMLAALLICYRVGSGSLCRADCMNNQKNLALAMLNYESVHGHFPGYVNRVGQTTNGESVVGSWLVPILPYIEREDLWDLWNQGLQQNDGDGDGRPDGYVCMNLLCCPSDPAYPTSPVDTQSSYVVNCGMPGDSDTKAEGVFHNHDVDKPLLISTKNIPDGAATTLLLSENLQAGRWTDTSEADLGMVWRPTAEPGSRINEALDVGDRPSDLRYARPSSHHPGGVIVSFCDGHVRFLSEDIDYCVYQHLMTPDSAAAGVPGELAEEDF